MPREPDLLVDSDRDDVSEAKAMLNSEESFSVD
jgi:hypothetical protein